MSFGRPRNPHGRIPRIPRQYSAMDVIYHSVPGDWTCHVGITAIVFSHDAGLTLRLQPGGPPDSRRLVALYDSNDTVIDGWVAGKLLSMFPVVIRHYTDDL